MAADTIRLITGLQILQSKLMNILIWTTDAAFFRKPWEEKELNEIWPKNNKKVQASYLSESPS